MYNISGEFYFNYTNNIIWVSLLKLDSCKTALWIRKILSEYKFKKYEFKQMQWVPAVPESVNL